MKMLRFDRLVFGPIHSRRLGSSLGINLLPRDGKLCNFDCVYCECGWNRDGRGSTALPTSSDVALALEQKLASCIEDGIAVDSITFSGHGEPTLHPDFARIVDNTIALRDKYMPCAKVSVLSNATTLDREDVLEALKRVDNPILKLDAGTSAAARAINRPADASYSVEKVVEGMEKFGGNFILQTMMLRPLNPSENLPDFAGDKEELKSWTELVLRLRPRLVMVYTLDRSTPDADLEKMSGQTMAKLVRTLKENDINVQIND